SSRHSTSRGHARHTDMAASSSPKPRADAASVSTEAASVATGVSSLAGSSGQPVPGGTGEAYACPVRGCACRVPCVPGNAFYRPFGSTLRYLRYIRFMPPASHGVATQRGFLKLLTRAFWPLMRPLCSQGPPLEPPVTARHGMRSRAHPLRGWEYLFHSRLRFLQLRCTLPVRLPNEG